MSSIPLVALTSNSAQQPGPLEQYGKVLQLKQLLNAQTMFAGQQQQQQQQLELGKQAIQEGQQKLAQTTALNEAYRNAITAGPDGNPSFDQNKALQSISNSGQGSLAPQLAETFTRLAQSQANLQKSQDDHVTAQKEYMAGIGSAMKASNYDPTAVGSLLAQASTSHPQEVGQLLQLFQQHPDKIPAIAEQMIAADPKTVTAGAAQTRADASKEASDTGAQRFGQEVDPNSPMNQAKVTVAANTAAAEGPIRTQQAVNTAKATAPIETQKAIDTQKALAGQGQAALANVPPHLIAPATAAATKAGTDFATATQTSDDMKDLLDLAGSNGNKVAYAYAPTTGVLQINTASGTKRINTAEIQQYGGAGSALDRVKGYFGKQVSGQSIPPNILSDMKDVAQAVQNNAQKKYESELGVINQNYGSSFKPAGAAQGGGQPASNAAPPAGIPHNVIVNGKVVGVTRDGGKTMTPN